MTYIILLLDWQSYAAFFMTILKKYYEIFFSSYYILLILLGKPPYRWTRARRRKSARLCISNVSRNLCVDSNNGCNVKDSSILQRKILKCLLNWMWLLAMLLFAD